MSGGEVVYFMLHEYVTHSFNVQPALDPNLFTFHFFSRDNLCSIFE